MIYAKKLKELREINNLTQENITKIIGLTRDVYGQYERESAIIPLKHLNTIANYYNVSIDYLFEFINKNNYENYSKELDNHKAGTRLKEFRKNYNLTQEKLGNILNTTKSVISGYESGRRLIATPFLYTICKKYHISADYLLGKIDEPKYF